MFFNVSPRAAKARPPRLWYRRPGAARPASAPPLLGPPRSRPRSAPAAPAAPKTSLSHLPPPPSPGPPCPGPVRSGSAWPWPAAKGERGPQAGPAAGRCHGDAARPGLGGSGVGAGMGGWMCVCIGTGLRTQNATLLTTRREIHAYIEYICVHAKHIYIHACI